MGTSRKGLKRGSSEGEIQEVIGRRRRISKKEAEEESPDGGIQEAIGRGGVLEVELKKP